jgi:site-specific recombinase XerD
MKTVSSFPILLESFFMKSLIQQQQASPHTLASYRDTFRLLLRYAQPRLRKAPSDLTLPDLDTQFLGAFLNHLESDRNNSARTRNARLAALHSFFRYVAVHAPEYGALAHSVLAMRSKRYVRRLICFLTPVEIDALLAAPDLNTWSGRRDRAVLLLAVKTGLRSAELTGLRCEDIVLGTGAHVRCLGKGRKQRSTPLRKETVAVLRCWLRERQGQPADPLFPSTRGQALGHDGLEYLLNKQLTVARRQCASLIKKHISFHSLRHSFAMTLLRHGAGRTVIALWLGHEDPSTTSMYLQADMQLKEQALAKTPATRARVTRYRPTDRVLNFLNSL